MPQSFVHSLGPVPKTTSLQQTLERAYVYAEEQGHRLVALEHLLLALTEDADGAQVLQASGIDLFRLRDEVAGFVGRLDDRLPPDSEDGPAASEELLRILDYAAAAAEQSGRRALDGAIVLAALIGEGKSPAAELLKAHGLTFETAIKTLQTRQSTPPTRRVPPAPPPRRFHKPGSPAEVEEQAVAGSIRELASEDRSEAAPTGSRLREMVERPERPVAARRPEGVGAAADVPPTRRPVPAVAPAAAASETAAAFGDDDNGFHRERIEPAAVLRPAQRRPAPVVPLDDYDDVPPQREARPTGRPAPQPVEPVTARNRAARPPAGAAVTGGRKPAAKDAGKGSGKVVEKGSLVENIPRRMRVGISEQVEVRISRRQLAQLSDGMQGRGRPVSHDVYVTQAMSVRLRAPDGGFFIETASPETQWIDERLGLIDNEPAGWRWTVTPKQRGRRKLQVIVAARTVNAEGINADTPLPDQTIEVSVATNYAVAARRAVFWIAAMLAGGAIGAFGEQAMRMVATLL